MTERELVETYFDVLNGVNSDFEFWLSATFALTLAFHFAGSHITQLLRGYLLSLYTLASLIFIARFLNGGISLVAIQNQLPDDVRYMNFTLAVPGPVIGPTMMSVMLAGTIGAIYYAVKASSKSRT